MFTSLILTLLVTTCLGTDDSNSTNLPLCTICTCHTNTKANILYADVICQKKIDYDIFAKSFWQIDILNKTYSCNYTSLNFQNNHMISLTQEFPPSNLTYLNLAHNEIADISKGIFKNLQNMKTLILSYNDLDNIDPDAFKGKYMPKEYMPLEMLRELRLDHNKLHTLNQNIFEHMTQIEILDLSHNPFKVIDHHTVVAIVELTNLKELYLQYTKISTLPDTMLHTPLNLQILDISGNPISEMPKTMGDVHDLKNLYMNNTGFVNLSDNNVFPDIPTLKVLHLCRNEFLYRLGKHSLSGLKNLEDLRLCDNNELSVIDPFALAKPDNEPGANIWPPLRKLHLGNNKLSYLERDFVSHWEELTELDIRGNPWTCECENQWLIDTLFPIHLKIDNTSAMEVKCLAPIEMADKHFYDLHLKKSHMRCLDIYGAHPENDALILVGILAGILITLPLVTVLVIGYQRKWFHIFGMCDNSPASYSRRFYSVGPTEEI